MSWQSRIERASRSSLVTTNSSPARTAATATGSATPEVDLHNARWLEGRHDLPTNPRTGAPVLLLPKRLRRDLPTLNAEDWFQSDVNEEVRTSLHLQIGDRIPKREIVKLARRNSERVREWARNQTSRQDLKGYDFGEDPKGVVGYDKAADFAKQHPLPPRGTPDTQAELSTLVGQVLEAFKHFVEQQGGWRLLWNSDGSEKNEEAAQLLFMAMARHYLRLFGVEVDREVELGRGPVDFKVTSGHSFRLLIEVKKVHRGQFWNGLNDQLPSYLASDQTTEGWFVAVQYRKATFLRQAQGAPWSRQGRGYANGQGPALHRHRRNPSAVGLQHQGDAEPQAAPAY